MKEKRALRAYADVALGRQRSPQHDSGPHMVPYLRAANVKDGVLDLSDVKSMNFDPSEQARFDLQPGDVLVTEGSGSLSAVGASAVWRGEISSVVCFQNTLLRLRPRATTDPRFLGWWCRYAFADGLFASVATGANIFHVSAERVRSLPMTYLDLGEQRAIADYLDTETTRIDTLITKKRRMIELLEEKIEAAVSDLLWKSGWPTTRLKYLCGLPTSGNRDHGSFTQDDSGVPCLRGLNVRRRRLDLENLFRISASDHGRLRQTQLKSGDLVIVRSGLAGSAAAIPEGFGPCNCVDLVVVRRSEAILPRLLEYLVNSTEAQEQVARHSAGALLTHFNAVDAGNLLLPVPPRTDQARILRAIDSEGASLARARSALEEQVQLLSEHRQALITAAVTGELEISGAPV